MISNKNINDDMCILSHEEMKDVILKLIYDNPDIQTTFTLEYLAQRYGHHKYNTSGISIREFDKIDAKRRAIRDPQVKSAISELIKNGSIKIDDNKYVLTDEFIENETAHFSLDESLRAIIQEIILGA